MTEDIFKVVLSIVSIVITAFIIPFIKAKLDEIKNYKLKQIIFDAVYAAQQTITDNAEKKEFVLNLVSEWLKEHKINISAAELDVLIESTVLSMKTETR